MIAVPLLSVMVVLASMFGGCNTEQQTVMTRKAPEVGTKEWEEEQTARLKKETDLAVALVEKDLGPFEAPPRGPVEVQAITPVSDSESAPSSESDMEAQHSVSSEVSGLKFPPRTGETPDLFSPLNSDEADEASAESEESQMSSGRPVSNEPLEANQSVEARQSMEDQNASGSVPAGKSGADQGNHAKFFKSLIRTKKATVVSLDTQLKELNRDRAKMLAPAYAMYVAGLRGQLYREALLKQLFKYLSSDGSTSFSSNPQSVNSGSNSASSSPSFDGERFGGFGESGGAVVTGDRISLGSSDCTPLGAPEFFAGPLGELAIVAADFRSASKKPTVSITCYSRPSLRQEYRDRPDAYDFRNDPLVSFEDRAARFSLFSDQKSPQCPSFEDRLLLVYRLCFHSAGTEEAALASSVSVTPVTRNKVVVSKTRLPFKIPASLQQALDLYTSAIKSEYKPDEDIIDTEGGWLLEQTNVYLGVAVVVCAQPAMVYTIPLRNLGAPVDPRVLSNAMCAQDFSESAASFKIPGKTGSLFGTSVDGFWPIELASIRGGLSYQRTDFDAATGIQITHVPVILKQSEDAESGSEQSFSADNTLTTANAEGSLSSFERDVARAKQSDVKFVSTVLCGPGARTGLPVRAFLSFGFPRIQQRISMAMSCNANSVPFAVTDGNGAMMMLSEKENHVVQTKSSQGRQPKSLGDTTSLGDISGQLSPMEVDAMGHGLTHGAANAKFKAIGSDIRLCPLSALDLAHGLVSSDSSAAAGSEASSYRGTALVRVTVSDQGFLSKIGSGLASLLPWGSKKPPATQPSHQAFYLVLPTGESVLAPAGFIAQGTMDNGCSGLPMKDIMTHYFRNVLGGFELYRGHDPVDNAETNQSASEVIKPSESIEQNE